MEKVKECGFSTDLIYLAIDNELSAEEQQQFLAHLPKCQKCREFYRRSQQLDQNFHKVIFEKLPQVLPEEAQKLFIQWQIADKIKNTKTNICSIATNDLPAVAGTGGELTKIEGSKYGLPPETAIVFDQKDDGYAVKIESPIPMELTLEFVKDGQLLFKTVISERILKQAIPFKAIEGWTHINISRGMED